MTGRTKFSREMRQPCELENLGDVPAAAAKRVCVVSAILNAPDMTKACTEFRQRLK